MNNENLKHLREMAEEAAFIGGKLSDEEIAERYQAVDNLPICVIEKMLEDQKANLNRLVRGEMPRIMIEEELQQVVLDDGRVLKLKKGINPKVKDKEKMIAWIEEINMPEVVKTELKFPKGEADKKLMSYLEKGGYSYEKDDSVHYMTLKKIVSDRYENGEGFPPEDAIEVTVYDEVKIS